MNDFSLASMAQIDTSEMEAVTSRVPAVGIYVMKGSDVTITESDGNNEKAPALRINFKAQVLEVQPGDLAIDPATLVGRTLTDSFPVWTQEDIAFLMGNFKKANLPYKGPMVDESGNPVGWLADFVGATFVWKITHRKRDDDVFANFTWMPFIPTE